MCPSYAKRPVLHGLLALSTSTVAWWEAAPGWNSGLPDGQTLRSHTSFIAAMCDSESFLCEKSVCQELVQSICGYMRSSYMTFCHKSGRIAVDNLLGLDRAIDRLFLHHPD